MYDTLLMRHLDELDTGGHDRYAVALKRENVDWQGAKVVELRQGLTRAEADAFMDWLAGKDWAGLELSPYRVETYRVRELASERERRIPPLDISHFPKPRITLYEYD